MNINPKYFRKKSPEAIALEATVSHLFLFLDRKMEDVKKRSAVGTTIDLELERVAKEMEADTKVREYVC